MLGYTWTGPIAPDSTISADQSTTIGESIIAAYNAGQTTAPAPAPQTFSSFLQQNQTTIVAGAAALLLLAVASSMNR
jgi:hypothetical protein